jgi:hypothetical protein
MSGDPIWYFFVAPVVLLISQLIMLTVILHLSNKLKEWWRLMQTDENYEDCYILSTASETRARRRQHRENQTLNTKEKLLNQGTDSTRSQAEGF